MPTLGQGAVAFSGVCLAVDRSSADSPYILKAGTSLAQQRVAVFCGFAVTALLVTGSPACAQFYVRSPEVENPVRKNGSGEAGGWRRQS